MEPPQHASRVDQMSDSRSPVCPVRRPRFNLVAGREIGRDNTVPPRPQIRNIEVNYEIIGPIADIVILKKEGAHTEAHFRELVGQHSGLKAEIAIELLADPKIL